MRTECVKKWAEKKNIPLTTWCMWVMSTRMCVCVRRSLGSLCSLMQIVKNPTLFHLIYLFYTRTGVRFGGRAQACQSSQAASLPSIHDIIPLIRFHEQFSMKFEIRYAKTPSNGSIGSMITVICNCLTYFQIDMKYEALRPRREKKKNLVHKIWATVKMLLSHDDARTWNDALKK